MATRHMSINNHRRRPPHTALILSHLPHLLQLHRALPALSTAATNHLGPPHHAASMVHAVPLSINMPTVCPLPQVFAGAEKAGYLPTDRK